MDQQQDHGHMINCWCTTAGCWSVPLLQHVEVAVVCAILAILFMWSLAFLEWPSQSKNTIQRSGDVSVGTCFSCPNTHANTHTHTHIPNSSLIIWPGPPSPLHRSIHQSYMWSFTFKSLRVHTHCNVCDQLHGGALTADDDDDWLIKP